MPSAHEATPCLQAALHYRSLGWSPILVCSPDHDGMSPEHCDRCNSPGKCPVGSWKPFQSRIADAAELEALWQRCPTGNVGLVTGRISGFVAIDVDGQEGEDALYLMAGGAVLPATLVFNSGRDVGYRLLYDAKKWTGPLPTIPITVDGKQVLKILGDGSQTVAPPSLHQNGERYSWRAKSAPGDRTMASIPEWLSRVLRDYTKARNEKAPKPSQGAQDRLSGAIFEGHRNAAMTRLAGAMRRLGATEEAMYAALVENNTRCVDSHGEPLPLTDRELRSIAKSIARYEPATDVYNNPIGPCNVKLPAAKPKPQPKLQRPSRQPDMRKASDIVIRPVDWIWPGWLVAGTLSIIEGRPGAGKSQTAYEIAARVTRGDVMPNGEASCLNGPADVTIMNCEDSWEQSILPRLIAAGADPTRITDLFGVRGEDGEPQPIQLPGPDAQILKQVIEATNSKLLLIEPFVAYMKQGLNINSYNDVYAFMTQLKLVAEETSCAIILARHQRKNATGKAIDSGMGSVANNGAVRTSMMVDEHPSDPTRCVLASVKSGMSKKPQSLEFRIVEAAVEGAGVVSKVEWLGPSDLSADQLCVDPNAPRQQQGATSNEPSDIDRAIAIIRRSLRDGPVKRTTILSRGSKAEIHVKTMRRAAAKIGVVYLEKFDKNNETGDYAWALPTAPNR